MSVIKVVITGPYATGKSQFIRTISEIEVVDTDVPVTNSEELLIKEYTTVGLDYGMITLESGDTLCLFGTPGQERFDFLWEVLAEGCLGYIVLVDSCRPAHIEDTFTLLQRFTQLTAAPFIVGATKQDLPGALPPAYLHRRLGLPPSIPVVGCNACDPDSVQSVLESLMDHIELILKHQL